MNKQGQTRRKNLESARKQMAQSGKTESELAVLFKELEPVEIPVGGERILKIFARLNHARTSGFSGPNPITFLELKAYTDVMCDQLEPYEVDLITACDRAYLDAVAEQNEDSGVSQ